MRRYENEDAFSPLSSHLNLDRPAAAKENSAWRPREIQPGHEVRGGMPVGFPYYAFLTRLGFTFTSLEDAACWNQGPERTVRWFRGSGESLRMISIVVVLFTAGLKLLVSKGDLIFSCILRSSAPPFLTMGGYHPEVFKGLQRFIFFCFDPCECSDIPSLFGTALPRSKHRVALFYASFTSLGGISPPSRSPRQ